MIKLKDAIEKWKSEFYCNDSKNFTRLILPFLVSNDWFGCNPFTIDQELCFEDSDISILRERVRVYVVYNIRTTYTEEKVAYLEKELNKKYPRTATIVNDIFTRFSFTTKISYHILDFLVTILVKELEMYSNNEITDLWQYANEKMKIVYCDALSIVLAAVVRYYKPQFRLVFSTLPRSEHTKEAFDSSYYSQLLYYLFNDEYIHQNHMYTKATEKYRMVQTWLYLSFHLLVPIRDTDLVQIVKPSLPPGISGPEVLSQIRSGVFSKANALYVLESVVSRLNLLQIKPNKTSNTSNVNPIRMIIPTNTEEHMGTLLAICAAHREIKGISDDEPILQPVREYEDICRDLGDEIGEIFIHANFSSISATKTVLQALEVITDTVGKYDGSQYRLKGYIIAAIARSHKGGYATFATTTATYLKDQKLSGMQAEDVAYELFCRGTLSWVVNDLLRLISGNDSSKLPVRSETKIIKALGISPYEAEAIVTCIEAGKKKANEIVQQIYANADPLAVLHRIANDEAVSKTSTSNCLIVATGHTCPYPAKQGCIGCEYEVMTRASVISLIDEYCRLMDLMEKTSSPYEKGKSEHLLKTKVLPALYQVLDCLQKECGGTATAEFEVIIQERRRKMNADKCRNNE